MQTFEKFRWWTIVKTANWIAMAIATNDGYVHFNFFDETAK